MSSLRVHVPRGTAIDVAGEKIRLDEAMGDFVVWRRDDLPAYQLASVLADEALGITHVVRGEDLLPSTAAQLFLAARLDATAFRAATFIHHPLVTDERGRKLSKSQVSGGRPLARTTEQRRAIESAAMAFGQIAGITAG